MDRDWKKPALLIYRDGRIMPDFRSYPTPWPVVAELWPHHGDCTPDKCPLPILERHFRFVGEAGPYAVFEEV